MNITLLVGHNYNKSAARLIQSLADSKISLSVIVCHSFEDLFGGLAKKMKRKELVKYIKEHGQSSLTQLAKKYWFKIYFSSHINSRLTAYLLNKIKPDAAVQFGIGIIRRHILGIPRLGIVNAHMGLLPGYRGMNVLEWSLFYDAPLGVSTHWMDDGIDTGGILLTKGLQAAEGDSIESLRDKAEVLCTNLLFETFKRIGQDTIRSIQQESKDGKQYYLMHPKLKQYIEMKLKT